MAYHLEGRLLEVCNCRVLCPCWIGEDPDFGTCDTIVAWRFDKGTIDGVDVSDRTIALIAHVPGNILRATGGPPSISTSGSRRRRRRRSSRCTRARRAGPVGELVKLIGEVVSVEKVPITFTVAGRPRHDQAGRCRLCGARAVRERLGRDDDARGYRVLDRARRAGVRRQVAALQVEEREARHRPRHQGPQRAAKHVRVQRVARCAAELGPPAAADSRLRRASMTTAERDSRPLPQLAARGRRAHARAVVLARAARRRCRGSALWTLEREPLWALPRARRLGRRRRARCAVPRDSAGRRRSFPLVLHAGAWVLMIAAMMLPTAFPLLAMFRRITGAVARTQGGSRRSSSPASSSRGSRSAFSRMRPTRRCAGGAQATPGSSSNGWMVGAAVLAGAGAVPVERAQVPLSRAMPGRRSRSSARAGTAERQRARRFDSASTTACSASAAAGR